MENVFAIKLNTRLSFKCISPADSAGILIVLIKQLSISFSTFTLHARKKSTFTLFSSRCMSTSMNVYTKLCCFSFASTTDILVSWNVSSESRELTLLSTESTVSNVTANHFFSLKCNVGAIVKSLLLRADNEFLVCLVAGDKRCSLKKIKKILKKKDVSMANANDVKINTGFSIGGVSPVGHIKKLDILIDISLNRFPDIFAAAGHPNCVFKINYEKLVKITNATEEEISE